MATFTTDLRMIIQAVGENPNVWGEVYNSGFLNMAEDVIAETVSVDVSSGNVTLTTVQGGVDEARVMFVRAFGTPGVERTIVVPDTSKLYILINNSDDEVRMRTATGTGILVPVDNRDMLFTDPAVPDVARVGGAAAIGVAAGTINSYLMPVNEHATMQYTISIALQGNIAQVNMSLSNVWTATGVTWTFDPLNILAAELPLEDFAIPILVEDNFVEYDAWLLGYANIATQWEIIRADGGAFGLTQRTITSFLMNWCYAAAGAA